MSYRDARAKLVDYRRRIAELRQEMRAVQATAEPEEVADYELGSASGAVRLAQLFGDKRDLILIHNMGVSCAYCTLWADGYNGIYDHLAARAAFVVSSPDAPDVQQRFAQGRGWRFRMVSHAGTTFAADMGYRSEEDGWLPGISVFRREGNRVLRVSDAACDVGDEFCTLWHIFDMLPEGAAGFRPKLSYGPAHYS
jgi:predicted dithiol-disulfide oxidoreductase (DUF899 family)